MTDSMLSVMPPPIREVEIPLMLSPSKVVSAEDCALNAFAPREARILPRHPKALLGTALHETMQELDTDDLDWDSVLERFEEQCHALETTGGIGEDDDLRSRVGFVSWNAATAKLRRWFENRSPSYRTARSALPRSLHVTGSIPVGSEVWLESKNLRLRGRADRVELTDSGDVAITDFKSGRVLDADGVPRPEYFLQISLYGLLMREKARDRNIRLFLSGAQRYELPFDRDREDLTRSWLESSLERWPPGSVRSDSLATPGPLCRWCRLRPACSVYRSETPHRWHSNEANLPFDCWGVVEQVGPSFIRVRSENGVLFHVEDAPHEILGGEQVAFFSLKSIEASRSGHHPRNYSFSHRFGSVGYTLTPE